MKNIFLGFVFASLMSCAAMDYLLDIPRDSSGQDAKPPLQKGLEAGASAAHVAAQLGFPWAETLATALTAAAGGTGIWARRRLAAKSAEADDHKEKMEANFTATRQIALGVDLFTNLTPEIMTRFKTPEAKAIAEEAVAEAEKLLFTCLRGKMGDEAKLIVKMARAANIKSAA